MTDEHFSRDDGAPYREIDDAVRALFEGDGRTVTGWALVISTSRIDSEVDSTMFPVAHGAGYAVGPGTSPAAALGLVDGLRKVLTKVVADEILGDQ